MGALDDEGTASVAPGDVWSLAWDGRHEGTVIISRVFDDHIMGIPLTEDDPRESELAVTVGSTVVAAWVRAETGLGGFLLHRRLGRALTADQISEARRWAAGRGELTTLLAGSGERGAESLLEVLDAFRRRCFIEWPSQQEATLDVEATGMSPRQFHEATGIDVGRVVELWDGHFLTEQEREALGDRLDEWTTVAADTPSKELSSPEVKDLVMELCSAARVSERVARNTARSAYALAARTDTVSARKASRAADTLHILIEEARAS